MYRMNLGAPSSFPRGKPSVGQLITKGYFTDGDTEAQRWGGEQGHPAAGRQSPYSKPGLWGLGFLAQLVWGDPGPLVFTSTLPPICVWTQGQGGIAPVSPGADAHIGSILVGIC